MFSKPSSSNSQSSNVILDAQPRLPLIITAIGFLLLLIPISIWPSVLVIIFGLFLLIQTFVLKLEFTSKDLIVWQMGRELRRFPFESWLAWRILLPKLPGLFYFREEASPHLLPILFDPIQLTEQLRLRVGDLETPSNKS